MTYSASIDALPKMVGSRNASLMSVVLRGLAEGVPCDQIEIDLRDRAGDPPLSGEEIVRAINRAGEYYSGEREWTRIDSAAKKRETALAEVSDEERGTVPRLILTGRRWMDEQWDRKSNVFSHFTPVYSAPPCYAPESLDLQAYQARTFLGTLWDTWEDSKEDGYVFVTNDRHASRTREHLYRPADLVLAISDWADYVRRHGRYLPSGAPVEPCIPQYVCPNLFTGEGVENDKGNLSYACKANIAHRRIALLEFDALSPEEQTAFGVGLLIEHRDEVFSITWSGHHSLHFLIHVSEPQTSGPFGTALPSRGELEAAWDKEWVNLQRVFSSHRDPVYRCDRACKDSTRLTRMPGAMRTDAKANGAIQELLYANPNAYND